MKKSKTLILLSILLLANFSKAQTHFQKTYGGNCIEQAFAISLTNDKGFIMAGYTTCYGAGAFDFYIIKTDSLGNEVWAKTYGGQNQDQTYDIQQTTDGGYIVAGYSKSFNSNNNYQAYMVKTNANGDTLWTRTYGGAKDDYANSVQQTKDGGYILSGYSTSFISGADSGSIYLIKTNANGNLLWSKALGGTNGYNDGYSVRQTFDKGYIVTGYTNGFGEPNGDAYLCKTDSSGNVSWTKTYSSTGIDWGNSVKQTSDSGYVVAGTSSFDSLTLTDVYLIKTNALGDTLWTKTYGGPGYDYGQDVQQTTDGGYIITGYTNSCDTCDNSVYLIKTDASGNLLWSNTNGGVGDDEGNYVVQTPDGGYAVGGFSNSLGSGDYDFYLIKTDANGNSCNQVSSTNPMKMPNTIQTTQTMQLYTANTIMHFVPTQLDSGNTTTVVCYPAGIKSFNESQSSITVFPNPNNGLFTLQLNSTEENVVVSIENNLGEMVYTGITNSSKEINLQSLSGGMYFVKVQFSDKVASEKIILTK
jgi:type IX secretion system substrate protein